MHPTIAQDLARFRIADFNAQADADRRLLEARREVAEDGSDRAFGSRWPGRPDPTGGCSGVVVVARGRV